MVQTINKEHKNAERRPSDIGTIPEDWEVKKLGEILKVKHGKSQKDVEVIDGKYPILGTGGLMGFTNSYLYNKESVLIGRKGTIDKPRFMNTPFWTVDTLFYTEIDTQILPKFIYYNFLLIDWYSYNEASGVPSLNAKTIEKIELALPPLPEQKRIAAALSDMDSLLNNLEELIAKKRSLKQGAMQELLKPKEGWVVKKIKEIASISTGSKNTQDRVDNGLYPFFVRSQTIERINSFSFDGEAVLTAGDGVGIGKVIHYVNEKFDIHQRVYKISHFDSTVLGFYFFLYFKNNFYERIMQMTAKSSVDSIRLEMISEMPIFIPPLSEQESIAKILSEIDLEIEVLEGKRAKYQQMKTGMMQELLTGRVRLV